MGLVRRENVEKKKKKKDTQTEETYFAILDVERAQVVGSRECSCLSVA